MALRHGPLLLFAFFLFALSSPSKIIATSRVMLPTVHASATSDQSGVVPHVGEPSTTKFVELSASSLPTVTTPITSPQMPTPTISKVTFDAEPTPSTSEAIFVARRGSSISMPPSSDNFVAFEVPTTMHTRPPVPNLDIRSCKPKGRMRYSAPSDRRNSEPLVSIVCSNMS